MNRVRISVGCRINKLQEKPLKNNFNPSGCSINDRQSSRTNWKTHLFAAGQNHVIGCNHKYVFFMASLVLLSARDTASVRRPARYVFFNICLLYSLMQRKQSTNYMRSYMNEMLHFTMENPKNKQYIQYIL